MSVASIASVSTATQAQFNPAALRNASPAQQRAAVAKQFEAILVRQLLDKTMTSMLGGAESGAAGGVYGDMLADTMSQQLTAGHGMGLSQFLQQQLTPRGELVTPTANASTSPTVPATQPQAAASIHHE